MLVVATHQTEGRGQMGTKWHSEAGKNLLFSMFIQLSSFSIDRQFQLNQAVSLGLLHVLKKYIPGVQIKWPNDILADTKKIAGILIENTVSNNKIKHSIVGVGLNVNQMKFPKEIPNASSLKLLSKKDLDLDKLLLEIKESIKKSIFNLKEEQDDNFQNEYLDNLYLYKKKTSFLNEKNKEFVGKIIGVTKEGRLQIELNSKELVDFGNKEVGFIIL